MSINKLILIFVLINLCWNDSEIAPDFVENLTCGKENPEKEKDCTKYGTGSGMLCCWVSEDKNAKSAYGDKCYLLPQNLAESTYGIKGDKNFTQVVKQGTKYWSCGNKSTFIQINLILLIFSLLLF